MATKRKRIPRYSKVQVNGYEYYKTDIEDADGKRIILYGKTREEVYDKEMAALEQIDSATFRRNSPTVAEFLIFEDTELSAYFDSLMLDLDFYFSTGAQIQTKLSLIGLVDLPLRLRLGYDSLSGRFVGSMLFSTSF